MKKILIAGGAGFLGSNMCKRLIKDNQVICVDNFYTGKKENIVELEKNNNFTLIEHDIIHPLDIKVDEIYNFACPASPQHYQKDFLFTLNTSVLGILNLLELAKKYNAKLLQASTSEIYGNPLNHPQDEQYWGNVNPVGVRSCYDEGKRCAETYLMIYHEKFGINTKIARIFNTYGENMALDDGRVVSNFINQAIRNQDVTVFGDGSQTRSLCYVDDLLDGLNKLMKSDINTPVNLGNDIELSVVDIAGLVIKLTNSKSKIIFKDLPQDDPCKRRPNLSKAKTLLDWAPKISTEEGLKRTIEYFIRKMNNEK